MGEISDSTKILLNSAQTLSEFDSIISGTSAAAWTSDAIFWSGRIESNVSAFKMAQNIATDNNISYLEGTDRGVVLESDAYKDNLRRLIKIEY